MSTALKPPDPIKHTLVVDLAIDADFVRYLIQYRDIFGMNYCGYWARGIEHDETGWLLWESDEMHQRGHEPERNVAIAAWRSGQPLPAGWYRLDRDAAIRAWCEGVKRWGVNWYDNVDASREDVVVQLSLLGEVRYG